MGLRRVFGHETPEGYLIKSHARSDIAAFCVLKSIYILRAHTVSSNAYRKQHIIVTLHITPPQPAPRLPGAAQSALKLVAPDPSSAATSLAYLAAPAPPRPAAGQVVAAGPYYPQFCLSVLTALVETSGVNEGRETAMLEDIQEFNTAVGTCEKVRGQRICEYMGVKGTWVSCGAG